MLQFCIGLGLHHLPACTDSRHFSIKIGIYLKIIHDVKLLCFRFDQLILFQKQRNKSKVGSYVFALVYLRFALCWLDLKLQSGPDALKKSHGSEFHIISYHLISISYL